MSDGAADHAVQAYSLYEYCCEERERLIADFTALVTERDRLRKALERIADGPFDKKRTRGFARLATDLARQALEA